MNHQGANAGYCGSIRELNTAEAQSILLRGKAEAEAIEAEESVLEKSTCW